jgi:membrane associated rhomboid family serine protease
VTLGLIAINVAVFLYQLSLELGLDGGPPARGGLTAAQQLVIEFGAVPCRLTGACAADFPSPVVTVFTSMFLHGGIFHVAGNMLYLWIFGDNVEDTLGHARFLLFYLLSGVAAAAAQTIAAPASSVPMIGASGAVSGVLGAYLLLFPYATIFTLFTFGIFFRFIRVPALVVLGFWIGVQLLNTLLTIRAGRGEMAGVAWFAHVGGFLAGMVLLFLLRPRAVARL